MFIQPSQWRYGNTLRFSLLLLYQQETRYGHGIVYTIEEVWHTLLFSVETMIASTPHQFSEHPTSERIPPDTNECHSNA